MSYTLIPPLLIANAAEQLEGFVLHLLVQLAAIIIAAQIGGWLFGRMGQPPVVGEILAGLILGPSCLGAIFPETLATLFPPEDDRQLRVLGQIGLVLLMFDVGLQFDFRHMQNIQKTAANVAIAGIVLPFSLGIALAWVMHPSVAENVDRLPFCLFVATALSITAIPILGRMMMDLGLESTPVGVLTISAAAVDDAIGWIVLAVVSGLVTGGFSLSETSFQLVALIALVVATVLVVRPLATRYSPQLRWTDSRRFAGLTAGLLLGVFAFAILTNLIGVFSVFGPFVLGACLSHRPEIQAFVRQHVSAFVSALFLPVFFTFTGLRTDIGQFSSELWVWFIAIFFVACFGKIIGCGLAARWGGISWRESVAIAVMMNTRALMGLIAINVGRDLGAIPDSVFSILVLVAIGTTVFTVPILRRILPSPRLTMQCGGVSRAKGGLEIEATDGAIDI